MLLLSLNVAPFLTAFLYLRWYSIIAAKQIARFFKPRVDTRQRRNCGLLPRQAKDRRRKAY